MSYLVAARRRDPFAGPFHTPFRAPSAPRPAPVPSAWVPSAEVVRDGEDAVVRLEVPGLKPEDISVEIADGRLVVSGERRDERSGETDGRTVREIRYGTFRRSFALPARTTDASVSASYDAGVLTVRVAGVYAGTVPVRIPVQSAAPAQLEAEAETDRSDGPAPHQG